MPPTTGATAASELCSLCRDLPFSEFEKYWFHTGFKLPGLIDTKRDEFEGLTFKINPDFLDPKSICSLCRLIASCCHRGVDGKTSLFTPYLRANSGYHEYPQLPHLHINLKPNGDAGEYDITNFYSSLFLTSIMPLSKELPAPGNNKIKTSVVDPHAVAFDRLLTWLQGCELEHQCLNVSGSQHCINGTRFIDCITRRVICIDDIGGSPSLDYIALSYVWGPNSAGSVTMNTKVLPIRLPQTIEDAIVAVQKLGIRYLWVDKYCIDQNDHDCKAEQIRSMDWIYQNAWATIVACVGSDCDYGLPGVRNVPRKTHLFVKTPNMTLVASLPPLHMVLEAYVWGTRGWTYQEAVLSKRLIFFTEYQVYVHCAGSGRLGWCESYEIEEGSPPRENTTTYNIHPAYLFRGLVARIYDYIPMGINDHMAEYSKRDLSFETDILNAFSGILSRSNLYNYYGLPFAAIRNKNPLSGADNFIEALTWAMGRGTFFLTHRHGFPSWSWAGWKGVVRCDTTAMGPDSEFEDEGRVCDAIVWLEAKNGTVIDFDDYLRRYEAPTILPPLSLCIHLEAVVIKFKLQPRHLSQYETDPWIRDLTDVHPPPFELPDRFLRFDLFHDGYFSGDPDAKDIWDCLLLSHARTRSIAYPEKTFTWKFLVLEDKGDWMERIGCFSVESETREWLDVYAKTERKKIRLS